MTGAILSFYGQVKYFKDNIEECKKFNISKPLLIFVGSTVNRKNDNDISDSDITDIERVLYFLKRFFANDNNESVIAIDKILKSESGFINKNKQDVFSKKVAYLISESLESEFIYKDILLNIFNCSNSGGSLHIENIKETNGEIALKLGLNETFGVIYIGNATKLEKSLKQKGYNIAGSSFKESLFKNIDNDNSNINILIGAKKFTEGWNCYRVSCMGLLNVGKSEGSSIIQLFGRGVRLYGYNHSLKRSSAYKKIDNSLKINEYFKIMECLNIFAINAKYMKEFEDLMKKEGIETEKTPPYTLNVIRNKEYKKSKLYTMRLKNGLNYKMHANIPLLQYERNIEVILEISNMVQSVASEDIKSNIVTYNNYHIEPYILPFLDYDNIYYKLQEYKNITGKYNINITKESLIDLLEHNEDWSVIHSYDNITKIDNFADYKKMENIAIMLLKKYFDKYYYTKKIEWESKHQEYKELDDEDSNFIEDDIINISLENDKIVEYESDIKKLCNAVAEAKVTNSVIAVNINTLKYVAFNNMFYYPLLYNNGLEIKISPVSLNKGEYEFLEDLKKHINENKDEVGDVYVMRNKSKKGVGFFVGSGFYPDFILWVVKDNKQYINFIDPHGISRISITDPKIELYKDIKEVEERLNNNEYNVILNSFIISTTSYAKLDKSESKAEWEAKHTYFQDDKEYIKKIFENMV